MARAATETPVSPAGPKPQRTRRPAKSAPTKTGSETGQSAIKVKPWNFRDAEGVDRVTLGAIRQVAEGITHIVANRLGTWTRARMSLNVSSIDQIDWEAFEAQVSAPGLLGAIPVAGGQMFVFLPAAFCMTILDLRLSGTGTGPYPSRPLSDIERQLLSSALEVVAGCITDATEKVFGKVASAPVVSVVASAGPISVNRGGACLTVTEVATITGIRSDPGRITVCFPLDTVRPLMAKLSESTMPSLAAFAAAEEAASRIPIPLALRYRPSSISLSVAEGLTPGQVLGIGHPIGEALVVCSGDRELFGAHLVEHNRRAAGQIVGPTEASGGASGP